MTDMPIRDVPEEVVAAIDAHACRLGLSRSEYVRRRLVQDAAVSGSAVTAQDLTRFTEASAISLIRTSCPGPGKGQLADRLAMLADRGQHRAPSLPDLIIAATAELAGLTVLHLDKDFEISADITGQATERLRA
jgi:Ribbon-helix-helix protein, copG family